MSGTKCRLCQCLVDKLSCFSSSLNDDGFRTMLKSVFPFPVSKDYTVASKTYNMPVLICFQCSTVIRNFYNFSKQVEAIQTKLKKECLSRDGSLPIDQLVQYIKEEPGLHEEVSVENMSANVEAPECESEVRSTLKRKSENHRERFKSYNDTKKQSEKEISSDPNSCVDKTEFVNSIMSVEKRVTMVAEKLDVLLRSTLNNAKRHRPASFEFSLINSEQEFKAFDSRLEEKEFMATVVSWLDSNFTSSYSVKRMHETVNALLSKAFFVQCTWTGNGAGDRNVALKNYKNVLKLFKLAATTDMSTVNDHMVIDFLKKKTKNAPKLRQ